MTRLSLGVITMNGKLAVRIEAGEKRYHGEPTSK
jgi:hypothetical protein